MDSGVVYGSCRGEATPRSEIDVAVVTRTGDVEIGLRIMRGLLGKSPACCDVRIFETLPLHMKAEVFLKYAVVFVDSLKISEILLLPSWALEGCGEALPGEPVRQLQGNAAGNRGKKEAEWQAGKTCIRERS